MSRNAIPTDAAARSGTADLVPPPRQPSEELREVSLMKRHRKPRSRLPKPMRYLLGIPWMLLLGSVGWSRTEADREQILRWMRGR